MNDPARKYLGHGHGTSCTALHLKPIPLLSSFNKALLTVYADFMSSSFGQTYHNRALSERRKWPKPYQKFHTMISPKKLYVLTHTGLNITVGFIHFFGGFLGILGK